MLGIWGIISIILIIAVKMDMLPYNGILQSQFRTHSN